MPKSTTCLLNGRQIDIGEALDLRDSARKRQIEDPDFLCIECDKPVCPHKESSYGAPHFEHRSRNPDCNLSDPAR